MIRSYRPDIDGLRALAVLSVVSFHIFPEYLPGGFVGVDIFFVISGFLISGILFSDLEHGRFSIAEFYRRRIKRIFPALILVMSATFFGGWLFLLPDEFRQLGKHIIGGSSFLSNILLWKEVGYFDASADTKPLLHLWSLGVEEQFYFVWPIILFYAWKLQNRVFLILFCITACSFILNVAFIQNHSVATFYSPASRLWELSSGALLAYAVIRLSEILNASMGAICSLSGCLILVASILAISSGSMFPGWIAIAPVVGAVLVLGAGPNAWANRLVLSHPVLVWIGKISFPLYLWHWPILVLFRLICGGELAFEYRVSAILVSIFLAWLTYQFIEKPVRAGILKDRLTPFLIIQMISVGMIGYAAMHSYFSPRIEGNKYLARIDDAIADWDFPGNDPAIPGPSKDVVLFIGDSFVEQYYSRAKKLSDDGATRYTLKYDTLGGCPPLPGTNRISLPDICYEHNADAFKKASDKSVKKVVIGSSWSYFYPITEASIADSRDDFAKKSMLYLEGDKTRIPIYVGSASFSAVIDDLEKKIIQLVSDGKEVYLILPSPMSDALNPKFMFSRISGQVRLENNISKDQYQEKFAPVISALNVISKRTGAVLLDPSIDLCPDGVCSAFRSGQPIYKDSGHIRASFARNSIHFLDEILR